MPFADRTSWLRRLLATSRRPDPRLAALEGMAQAVQRSQAVIEFDLDGRILDANAHFLAATGYRIEEIRGQHHRIFVLPEERPSAAYAQFWQKLREGHHASGQFRRIAKNGSEIWIQASYTPVLDAAGKPAKVLKFATDITAQKRREAETQVKLDAIERSMAVIEFDLDGRILRANAHFLAATGYSAAEVLGQHHRMFVAPEQRESSEYAAFWARLREGQLDRGQYRRLGKGGREVWIEASYNPVLDATGKPFKVVKFATDITAQHQRDADFANQMQAIDRSLAVIEFNVDGSILGANANFLAAVGYGLAEIVGKHHRLFVADEERDSAEYLAFWAALAKGEARSGRFRRIRRNGEGLWLEASYNPILGADGKPYKVVKYATDITPAILSMMGEIKTIATLIRSGTGEISSGNDDVARRTEAQAASIEETAATMQELTSTVRHNAENARQAKDIAAKVALSADNANQVVHGVMGSMAEIETSSRRIADIIGLIDGIAFQTNILALNAAVEAARAGEQGRGFAVVATEVRALAQRSATAAREIKALIGQSTSSVQHGVERSRQAEQAMQGIVRSVQQVAGLIQDIATGSAEQAAGISQISTAIKQLDQGVQQNAALVEEAAASARVLDEQADGLMDMVSVYLR